VLSWWRPISWRKQPGSNILIPHNRGWKVVSGGQKEEEEEGISGGGDEEGGRRRRRREEDCASSPSTQHMGRFI